MPSVTYQSRRGEIATYFDKTAADTWAKLTSDAPVSKVRATVRAGRDRMRGHLLGWLPADLTGKRVLDAGCGTGTISVELAQRGAEVVAVDLSPTLIEEAQRRLPSQFGTGSITFIAGDLLDPSLGEFDHMVAMDSLIHYGAADAVDALGQLASRVTGSMVFTFVPRTPFLAAFHFMMRTFPRAEQAPLIQPTPERKIFNLMQQSEELSQWHCGGTERVSSGFYISQGMELHRP